MKHTEFTEEEKIKGQEEIDAWFEYLPVETVQLLKELRAKMQQMETFDLLSNISMYNHIHEPGSYADYRGDKMFVVSEIITLIALQSAYVAASSIDMDSSPTLIQAVQDLGHRYFSLVTALQMRDNRTEDDHSMAAIAFRNMRDETIVRNPMLPEHHLMFSAELYAPLDTAIKEHFGFSIGESITIRKAIVELINEKVNNARDAAKEKGEALSMEVFKYRSTKVVPENSSLTAENLEQLNQLSRKQIKHTCEYHCMNNMLFNLGKTYSFTANELSDFTALDINVVNSFIKQFSCSFPAVKENDLIVGPTSILKTKPLVWHNGNILIPSIPLLNFCVEPVIEDHIKSNQKLSNRFKDIKHDFLLQKGSGYFSKIFNGKVEIFSNMYYYERDDKESRCETDGIFSYERNLFIIEAKGQRITQAAKEGKIIRTEKHMDEIVKESYEQGLRTLRYIRSKPTVEFSSGNGNLITINQKDFDEIILVTLVLEPIGNVTPLIRVTNELGYFKDGVFPWVVSMNDLLIISDHFDFPFLLPHYIKRRKEFLSKKVMRVFEEGDLLSYYLSNRLYIERLVTDGEADKANVIYMDNETDVINNYYVEKYQFNNPTPSRLKLNLPDIFISLLKSVAQSKFTYRQEILMALLDLSPSSIDSFKNYIVKVKGMFFKDGGKHDCSILTELWGKKVGFTFVTGPSKVAIDQTIYFFCQHKMNDLQADIWVGVGDTERSKTDFNIECGVVARY